MQLQEVGFIRIFMMYEIAYCVTYIGDHMFLMVV